MAKAMAKIVYCLDEMYTFWFRAPKYDFDHAKAVDVPQELWDRHQKAADEFWKTSEELTKYLKLDKRRGE